MNKIINGNKDSYFLHLKPKKENKKPLIITSPHSGILLDELLFQKRRSNVECFDVMQDMYVNDLSNGLEALGFTVIQSNISRLVIDLNRNTNEIDPKYIEDMPKQINYILSDKVKSGIGLISFFDGSGKNIYENKITWSELCFRIENYYKPWHLLLKDELNNSLKKFGRAFLIDLHSMPSKNFYGNYLSDFVIGNNFGKSSSNLAKNALKSIIKSHGYSVSVNDPYSGGYITKNYSSLDKNIQCIQLEIKKSLYMDEKNFTKNENFDDFALELKQIIFQFFNELDQNVKLKYAAE